MKLLSSVVALNLFACLSAAAPSTCSSTSAKVCKVKPLGHLQDDGPNIVNAVKECDNGGTVVLDGFYIVGSALNTTNLTDLSIELSGTIQYTPDIAYWSPNSYFLTYQNATTYWLFGGTNIRLYGGGTIDANGQIWYNMYAADPNAGVAGGSSRTFARPIPITVANANGAIIENITYYQSPFWNNFCYQSTNVTYRNLNLTAVSLQPNVSASNTDGIDIYQSSYVTFEDNYVNNGDDCVSFKPNATNILVQNVICNGSHGISVGSLGQYSDEVDIVANITARNISMMNTEYGARIKVFGGSNVTNSISGGGTGYVKNITFEDFTVMNTDEPIYITQCYETSAAMCVAYPSKLSISDVHYINITGTSSGVNNGTVVDLECSAECEDITASDIQLTSPTGPSVYWCANIADEASLPFNCTPPTGVTSS